MLLSDMLFTYWTGQASEVPPSTDTWRARFPSFSVFGDADVLPLLDSDNFREIYRQITIPACKSDIARLVLLRQYGGLYVDSHTGPSDGDRLLETLEALSSFDLILFDKTWEHKHEGDIHLMNSALAARRGAAVLNDLIFSAFTNLIRQRQAELQTPDYVPYNIFVLTGAWDIGVHIFDRSTIPYRVKPKFEKTVFINKMKNNIDPGFHLYKFYQYRKPGQHWSERQSSERLFHSNTY